MWHPSRRRYLHRRLFVENGKYRWKTAELKCSTLYYAGDSRDGSNQRGRLPPISVQLVSRRKRETETISNGPIRAVYAIDASVPFSCCTQEALISNNTWTSSKRSTCYGHGPINLGTVLFSSACLSSDTDPSRQLYQKGCAESLIARANRQDMGIGIINCFLLVFAIFAFPLLWFGAEQLSSNEYTVFEKQWNGYANQDRSINNGMTSPSTIRL